MQATKTIQLEEYKTASPTEENDLCGLYLAPEDMKLAKHLEDKGILTILELKNGIRITANSHVGVVQFSNFRIDVLPKIQIENLARLIQYAYDLDIVIPESEIKFDKTENILIEIVIASFVKQAQRVLRQGLAKAYMTHQGDISHLRGKLLLRQQFLHVVKRKIQFACEFDELEHDILENRIIRYTLERCLYMPSNESLRKEIRVLIHQISGFVDRTKIGLEDFEKIHYTRLNQHYEKIHQLCKLIISSLGISDFYQQKTSFVNSFFVDMNAVFETFVAKLFKEHYPLDTEAQKGTKAWKSDAGGSVGIRTDVLIYDKDGSIKDVIDTKYKKGLSEGDRFQIGFYIHEYKTKQGYAILPQGETRDYKITSNNQGITINVRHMSIDNMLELVFSDKSKIQNELERLVPI